MSNMDMPGNMEEGTGQRPNIGEQVEMELANLPDEQLDARIVHAEITGSEAAVRALKAEKERRKAEGSSDLANAA